MPDDCEHLARTSAYFDGALGPDDETAAAEHLATCAACQALLGDAIGIDAALSQRAKAEPRVVLIEHARARRGRRWIYVGGAAVAAAAAVVLLLRRHPAPSLDESTVAIALPHDRALEAQFTGARFSPHRPLGALRGEQARESIGLAAMAELERRGETHDLVAALASSGDLARAKELAAQLPDDAPSDADRAALALAAHDPEAALRSAYHAVDRAPGLAAGWWNLAIAARDLGQLRVARQAFARVAAAGWSDEAKHGIAAIDRDLARELGFPAFEARAKAMVAGGAVLDANDVARYPAFSRYYFHEAVRVAPDRARLDALAPLAAVLDGTSGASTAQDAIGRADPAMGAKFGAEYRALVERTATPAQARALIARLRDAGRGADDLRAGAIILAGQARPLAAELAALVAPWHDPWLSLAVEREQIHAKFGGADLRAEAPLLAAFAHCDGNDAWALRCGQLALDLADLAAATGRYELAEERGTDAAARLVRAGAFAHLRRAQSLVAEQHRLRGRAARARAEFEELALAAGDNDCAVGRYAANARAGLALLVGDLASARAALPPAGAPAGCPAGTDLVGFSTAIDLARRTHDPADLRVADQWLAAQRALGTASPADEGLALVGAARISRGEPAASRAVMDWLAAHAADADPVVASERAWGTAMLAADAGERGDWDAAYSYIAAEHPRDIASPCALAASADDTGVTIAIRTPSGTAGAQQPVAYEALGTARLVPAPIAQQLATCQSITVIARPPLHGRADLLPAELPWAFAGDAPPHAPTGAAARALEVADARPPDPALPRLPATDDAGFTERITGADAMPARVLAALSTATYAELHVHGIASGYDDDAAYLALSPAADGTYALTAAAVRAAKLGRAPLVVLAACRAATVAAYRLQRFSLPDAFLAAGASAVVAADVAIPDTEARPIFADLRRRVAEGQPVAAALAELRAASPPGSWVRHLMVFE